MASKTTETPPSSQALQRRLIVEQKQVVYSDLPRGNRRRASEGTSLHNRSFHSKKLATIQSQVTASTGSPSNHVTISSREDPAKNGVVVAPPPLRRKSVHAMIDRESSPLRRGAKTIFFRSSL